MDPQALIPQVVSRRIGEERVQLYETSTGRYYLPTDAPQDCVISCIKSGGVWEPEIVETAKAYMRPGITVLDVGANFGQMSVLFSRFVGAGGQVHSFEADPFVYELLQKTLAANNCQNVTAHLVSYMIALINNSFTQSRTSPDFEPMALRHRTEPKGVERSKPEHRRAKYRNAD